MAALIHALLSALADLTALVGAVPWSTAKVHLFSNNFVPDPTTPLTGFTECVYSGYAAKAITWSPAFVDTTGTVVVSSGEILFQQSGATNDVCYGCYITDMAGTSLLASGNLDTPPFNFSGNGTTLPLLLKLDVNSGLVSISPVP